MDKFSDHSDVISNEMLNVLSSMGFTIMTEIQKKCIPILLQGKDVRGTAKTGSGKTLTFLIPVIERMKRNKLKISKGTRAIIIAPTRELALQIYSVMEDVLINEECITYGILMGGAKRKTEEINLKMGLNIIIATPGRLLDHLKNTKHFKFKKLKQLVIDEADRILEIGFEKDMKQIISLLPKKRQTVLFSATKSQKIEDLSTLALKTNLIDVDVDVDKRDATVDGLQQCYVICPSEKRFLFLYTFFIRNKKQKIMVFFSSCLAVKYYKELCNFISIPVKSIHGRQQQSKRTSTFFEFMGVKSGILLCTDVAARGLDIKGVDWIVQYDPPLHPKEYIHRVGRTARAGANGSALLILQEEEVGFVEYLNANKVIVNFIDNDWTKLANVQSQIEKLLNDTFLLYLSAKRAFRSCIKAYASHRLKDVFDVNKLDLNKIAKCFGLSEPPELLFSINPVKKKLTNYHQKGPSRKEKFRYKLLNK